MGYKKRINIFPAQPFSCIAPVSSDPPDIHEPCARGFKFKTPSRETTMPITFTARGWLMSYALPLVLPPHPPADGDTQDLFFRRRCSISGTNENDAATSIKCRRAWAQPIPVNKQGECCVFLACVKRFAADGESLHARTLAKEQESIRECTTRVGRKTFVYERVPVVNLGRGGGSMLAGGISVCTIIFKSSFGVSNHVTREHLPLA